MEPYFINTLYTNEYLKESKLTISWLVIASLTLLFTCLTADSKSVPQPDTTKHHKKTDKTNHYKRLYSNVIIDLCIMFGSRYYISVEPLCVLHCKSTILKIKYRFILNNSLLKHIVYTVNFTYIWIITARGLVSCKIQLLSWRAN